MVRCMVVMFWSNPQSFQGLINLELRKCTRQSQNGKQKVIRVLRDRGGRRRNLKEMWLLFTTVFVYHIQLLINDAVSSKWWLHCVLKLSVYWINNTAYLVLQTPPNNLLHEIDHDDDCHSPPLPPPPPPPPPKNMSFNKKFVLKLVSLLTWCYLADANNSKWSL